MNRRVPLAFRSKRVTNGTKPSEKLLRHLKSSSISYSALGFKFAVLKFPDTGVMYFWVSKVNDLLVSGTDYLTQLDLPCGL